MTGDRSSVGRGFLRGSLSRPFAGEEGLGKVLGLGSRASGRASLLPRVSWLAWPWKQGPQLLHVCRAVCLRVCLEGRGRRKQSHGRADSLSHTQKHTDVSPVNHPASESAPRIPVGE